MADLDSETSLSIRDELESGLETPETEAHAAVENPIPAELPPLEAPAMWGKQYKETFAQIAGNPEQRAVAEKWLEQWKETQGYVTRKDQEFADYRKRLDPVYSVIQPYEQYWAQQGMTTETGVRQLLAYAEGLARDPASMIPHLAQMYGVDLQQLVAEQPYIPQEMVALQQQIQQLQHANQQQQYQQQQAFHARLGEEIRAFQTATDEQGIPKAPHFERVFDTMLALARGGAAKNIQEAYDKAVRLDAELQTEIASEKAKQEAAARAAEANKAAGASRTVKSKSTTETQPNKSIRSALEEGLAEMGLT